MTGRWDRVEELFAAAAGLDPPARAEFLEQCGAEDAELRREVEALLRADEACGGDGFLLDPISAEVDRLWANAEPSQVGQVVGAYRLTAELGHGGMGRVYLAERVDQQYRAEVAIKFVRGAFASPELVARFRAERQILADLVHPNIARLLDGGSTADGTPFLVMERIVGRPIDHYCDEHLLGLAARLELFLVVAGAVQYAHQALIVHRDLKPSNIMVTEAGVPKLLDFGIAKLLDPGRPGEDTTLLPALTPAYASPEQYQGARATVAADVYSLGVVLYRLVTGREPFALRGLTPGEVERILTQVEPERPSLAVSRSPGREAWTRGLAGDLDTIIQRTLAKTPGERYPSVAAMAEDLRRYLDGRPILARRATWRYRVAKFIRRHRREVLVGTLVFLTVVSLTGWYLYRLDAERDRARLEADKAAEVAAFLQQLFEVSDPSLAKGQTITARELLDQGAARVRKELAGQPAVQATMMRVIGNVYGTLGLSDQAKPLLEESLALHRALFPDPNPETATTEIALGVTLQDLGDVKGAEPLLRHALSTRGQLARRDDRSVIEARRHLAYLLETIGDYAGAESLLVDNLRSSRRLYPPGDPALADAAVKLGGLLRRLDQPDSAEPLLREGLAVQRARFGERDLDVASTERNLAALLRDKKELAEAESLYRMALDTRRALLGDSHPEVATTLNSYALLLQQKGDSLGAVAAFTEFVGLIERIYREPHPSLAAGYSNLAFALIDVGRLEEAAANFKLAMAVQERVLPRGHANRAHPLIGLADVRMRQNRPLEAETSLRRAVRIRRSALPAGHHALGEALSDLGDCLTSLHRYAAAESALVEARTILQAAEPDASRTRRAVQRLATLYDLWDRPDQAAAVRLSLPSIPTTKP